MERERERGIECTMLLLLLLLVMPVMLVALSPSAAYKKIFSESISNSNSREGRKEEGKKDLKRSSTFGAAAADAFETVHQRISRRCCCFF